MKIQCVVEIRPKNLLQATKYTKQNRPKKLVSNRKSTLKMAHPVPQYIGVTSPNLSQVFLSGSRTIKKIAFDQPHQKLKASTPNNPFISYMRIICMVRTTLSWKRLRVILFRSVDKWSDCTKWWVFDKRKVVIITCEIIESLLKVRYFSGFRHTLLHSAFSLTYLLLIPEDRVSQLIYSCSCS